MVSVRVNVASDPLTYIYTVYIQLYQDEGTRWRYCLLRLHIGYSGCASCHAAGLAVVRTFMWID